MNNLELLFICFSTYLILFGIGFILPKYNDVFFMVRFTHKSEEAALLVKSYRQLCFNLSLFLFIITFILETNEKSMFFLSSGMSLYVMILFFLYTINSQKIIKLKQNNLFTSTESKMNFDIEIKPYHYILQLFFVSYMFFFTNAFVKGSAVIITTKVFLYPITSLFLLGFILILISIIQVAPPLANNHIKKSFYNFLYLCSLSIFLLFLTMQWILIYQAGITFIISFFIIYIPVVLLNIKYLSYIKMENHPYEFKIANEKTKLKDEKIITTSLNGTKILLNLSNKKSYMVVAGLLIYFLAYFWAVYVLII